MVFHHNSRIVTKTVGNTIYLENGMVRIIKVLFTGHCVYCVLGSLLTAYMLSL